MPKNFLIPYVISNLVFLLCILGAIKRPHITRVFLCLGFLAASCFNAITSVKTPDVYLLYSKTTFSPVYKNFIDGFFANHITGMVLLIAAAQFLIAVGLALKQNWVKLACIGGIIFGFSIAPLGVGSAFPATISMGIAFFILNIRYTHDFIWKVNQYRSADKHQFQ